MENFNALTNSIYSATNQSHLEDFKELFRLESNEWAGFKQWNELGRKVVKGAKGCKIFIICEKKIKGKDEKKKVLKALYVFNKEHTEEV